MWLSCCSRVVFMLFFCCVFMLFLFCLLAWLLSGRRRVLPGLRVRQGFGSEDGLRRPHRSGYPTGFLQGFFRQVRDQAGGFQSRGGWVGGS